MSWLRDNNIIVENLREEHIIVGKFDVGDDFLLVNHILLLGKYYIYSQKCQKGMPSLGLGVCTTLNFTLPGKEASGKRKWETLINKM